MLNVENYYIENDLRIDRTDTALGRGGGLIVFIRNDVSINVIDCDSNFNQFCKFSVALKHNRKECPFYVTLVYRSPNSSDENTCKLAKLIESCEKNSLIIGDFNLPNLDIEKNTSDLKGRPVLEAAQMRCMTNVVNFPTHIRGNTLDLALFDADAISNVYNVENVGNLSNSDHAIIKIEMVTVPAFNESTQMIFDWRKGDLEGLRAHLQSTDFVGSFQDHGTCEAWTNFRSIIEDSIQKFIPLKPRRKKSEPQWMTRFVKNLVNRKKRCWKKYTKNRTEKNFEKYKEAEKKCKKGVQNAKRRFERSIADNGNKRPFSAYVKSKTKSRANVGPLKVNGEVVSDNKKMAEILNDYFTSVFTKEPPGPVPKPTVLPSHTVISDIVFDVCKVKKRLQALKPDSAPGPDRITTRFLRDYADLIAPPLTHLFNKSMQEGAVPEDWKRANVTPIFKKGVKGEPGNYRPVSLTSVPCRVMEAYIKDEIVRHLKQNKLINESQHGFMSNKSCTTNLLEFFEKVTAEVDSGNVMDIVYLDFSKAFDKVPHRRLIEKISAHSVQGSVLNWIREWLSGRTQRTVLNGETSEWQAVHSGVPQGSVLGPLAFVIFINDLDHASRDISILNKFADDTKCGQTICSDSDIETLQTCLNRLTSWAETWGMAFNVKKCKVLHVGRKNPQAVYTMNGMNLEPSVEEKDIGVKVCSSLKPSTQCREAAQRANAVLTQISRSFHYRDRKTFIKLYKQYVRPHLEFAVPAWSPWLAGDKEVLERVQERAVRMVSGLKGPTYREKLRELDMPSLETRRLHYDLTQAYKIVQGKDDVNPATWFELVGTAPTRATRQSQDPNNIKKKNPNTDLRKNFFSNRIVDQWNKLPSEVKKAKSVTVFKSYVEKHIKDQL